MLTFDQAWAIVAGHAAPGVLSRYDRLYVENAARAVQSLAATSPAHPLLARWRIAGGADAGTFCSLVRATIAAAGLDECATPNHAAIVEALNAAGLDEGRGLYPNHRREAEAWAILVDCYAPDAPDAATVYVAAHCVMGLTRIATGRDGLNLLRDWLTVGFSGHSTAEMVDRSTAWIRATALQRLQRLAQLDTLAEDVAREVADFPDAAEDLAELQTGLADMHGSRAGCHLPELDWIERAGPAVRAWRFAVHSFGRLFPMRCMDPLDCIDKVRAARAVKAVHP